MQSQKRTAISPAGQHRRSVAMPAKAMPDDCEGCLAAGICGYAIKPIRVDALVDAMLWVAPGKQG